MLLLVEPTGQGLIALMFKFDIVFNFLYYMVFRAAEWSECGRFSLACKSTSSRFPPRCSVEPLRSGRVAARRPFFCFVLFSRRKKKKKKKYVAEKH